MHAKKPKEPMNKRRHARTQMNICRKKDACMYRVGERALILRNLIKKTHVNF